MKKVVLIVILIAGSVLGQGYWTEPVMLPDNINQIAYPDSLGDHFHGHISPDGTELYYTITDFHYNDDIYVARYDRESDVWDSVTRLSVNMNDSRRELSPSITADHSRLFWCCWGRPSSYGGYDVWYAEWDSVAGDWGEPQNAGPNVNTPGYEFTCFIAPDGKTLYVSSDWDSDSDDIYKHTLQPDSTWGPREKVFEELHPGGYEFTPWVSADGKWLYFSIYTGASYGEATYRSQWQGEYFGEPELIPEPISQQGRYQWNFCPSLNAEGSRLYFSSNRPDSILQASYLWYSDYIDAVVENEPIEDFDLSSSFISSGKLSIRYSLTNASQVFCCIFDTSGNLIRILENTTKQGGKHTIAWDGVDERGRSVPSGTYFIHLTVDKQRTVKKTLIIN